MPKARRSNDFAYNIIILIICILPVVLSFFMVTDGKNTGFRTTGLMAGFGIPCFFNALTGYRCPACGMTRAFIYMSGLNTAAAWEMNRSGVLLYVFCVFQLPYRLINIIKPSLRIYGRLLKVEAVYLIITGIISVWDFAAQFL